MLLKFRGQSTDMFVHFVSIWHVFLKWVWMTHSLLRAHMEWEVCFGVFFFQACALSRGKNNSISLLRAKVMPNSGLIYWVSEPASIWNTVLTTESNLGKLVITGSPALCEREWSIWKVAQHGTLKSKWSFRGPQVWRGDDHQQRGITFDRI